MLAARIGLAGAMERIDEDEPLVDVVLALSASTAGMIALLDGAAGRSPLTAIPCALILVARLLRRNRLGVAAALLVWLPVLELSPATSILAPLLMIAICFVLLLGPGRVLDWLEARWDAAVEGRRRRREARLAAGAEFGDVDAIGWIEDLPEGAAPPR